MHQTKAGGEGVCLFPAPRTSLCHNADPILSWHPCACQVADYEERLSGHVEEEVDKLKADIQQLADARVKVRPITNVYINLIL